MRFPLIPAILFALLTAVTTMPASAASKMEYVKRVESFYFLVDESGSMGQTYKPTGVDKSETAKTLLAQFNARIPALDYQAGLATFAPYELLSAASLYDRDAYGQAVAGLPASKGIFGYPTPLGNGFMDLKDVVEPSPEPIAAILLSDGMENTGASALAWGQKLVKNHGVCLHTISLANNDRGQRLLDKLANLEPTACTGVAVSAADLMDNPAAQDDFLRKVLYTTQSVEMAAAPAPKDTDGDGVYDKDDQCPDTPMDLMVDNVGCPIPLRATLEVNFDTDKDVVKPVYYDELKEFADTVRRYHDVEIVIEGHTDSVGDDAYNKDLSQRRAQAVLDALVQQYGLYNSTFTAKGFGEERPIASNDTAAGRAQNRRVEGVLPTVYKKK